MQHQRQKRQHGEQRQGEAQPGGGEFGGEQLPQFMQVDAVLAQSAVGVVFGEKLFTGKKRGEQEGNPQRCRGDAGEGIIIRAASKRKEADGEGEEQHGLQQGVRAAQAGAQFAADEER